MAPAELVLVWVAVALVVLETCRFDGRRLDLLVLQLFSAARGTSRRLARLHALGDEDGGAGR